MDYKGLNPVIITVLRGAVYFLLTFPVNCQYLTQLTFSLFPVTDPAPGQVVRITKDLEVDIHGQHVLLVEDIIDTGLTLHYLIRTLRERGPASLKVCTFLDRPVQRIAKLQVDYRGFETDEEYLVGYGLDYKGKWRNLPYIMAVTE